MFCLKSGTSFLLIYCIAQRKNSKLYLNQFNVHNFLFHSYNWETVSFWFWDIMNSWYEFICLEMRIAFVAWISLHFPKMNDFSEIFCSIHIPISTCWNVDLMLVNFIKQSKEVEWPLKFHKNTEKSINFVKIYNLTEIFLIKNPRNSGKRQHLVVSKGWRQNFLFFKD